MPRSSETPESGGRAPRKRAVRTRATRASSRSSAPVPERVAPEKPKRKVEAPAPATPAVHAEVRKAPTPLAAHKVAKRRRQRQLLVVAIVLASGVGASAAVGLTDAGTIDVQQTIEARNERIRNNQATESDLLNSTVEVPVQNTNVGKPNGGLVGRGTGGLPPTPPPPPATTTATSSDLTASSTEAVASSTAPAAASSTESVASSTPETATDEG